MDRVNFSTVRLLVVEDSPRVMQLLCNLLRSLGCAEIHEARSGEEALLVLRHVTIDLMIIGGGLEGPAGGSFIRRVRTDPQCPNRAVPIIALTKRADAKPALAARDAGATDFLAKPISADRLFERLAAALAGSPRLARVDAEARSRQWTEALAAWIGRMEQQRRRRRFGTRA